MSTDDDYWLAASGGARLVDLTLAECLDLLAAKRVGRLAFGTPTGPSILPLNYVLEDRRIVVRTIAYGQAAQHVVDRPVAFEVDDVDDFLQAGWSVVVHGTARLLSPEQVEALRHGSDPAPWAEGPRTLFLVVDAERVSGRRLLPR